MTTRLSRLHPFLREAVVAVALVMPPSALFVDEPMAADEHGEPRRIADVLQC